MDRPLFDFFANIGEKLVPVKQEQGRVSMTWPIEDIEKLREEFRGTDRSFSTPEAGDITILLLGDILEIEDAPRLGFGEQRTRKPD